jgi:MFS family permease
MPATNRLLHHFFRICYTIRYANQLVLFEEASTGQRSDLYTSNQILGLVNTVFMLCYSIGLAFIEPLGDRFDRCHFIAAGC